MKTLNSLIIISFLCIFSMVGCNGNEGWTKVWTDVYGNPSGKNVTSPGFTFYRDKNGKMIRANAFYDPFKNDSLVVVGQEWVETEGGYGLGGTFIPPFYGWKDVYDLPYQDYTNLKYTDEYGDTQFFTGSAWISPSGVIYEKKDGFAINLAGDNDEESRDSIESLSNRQKAIARNKGIKFANRYALSEDTGIHIAQTVQDYATLVGDKKDGSRTEKDLEDFTRRLSGVDLGQALVAFEQAKNGDKSGIMSLNNDVAIYWRTTPEQSVRILKYWFKEDLK